MSGELRQISGLRPIVKFCSGPKNGPFQTFGDLHKHWREMKGETKWGKLGWLWYKYHSQCVKSKNLIFEFVLFIVKIINTNISTSTINTYINLQ